MRAGCGLIAPAVFGLALALSSALAAAAEVPKAVIRGVEDAELRREIQRVVGESEDPPQSRFEARRRARDAGEQAIAVLRSEGYYGYQVTADVEGGEAEGQSATPVVQITPGPRFTFGAPQVAWVGAAPAEPAASAGQASVGLTLGAPGRSADVLTAEGRVLAALSARGYADAKAEPREVVVDHADTSVRPTFRIAAGELVRMDGIELSGASRTDTRWLRGLAPWREGEVYQPDDVAELERRLLDAGVYDSVTVALAPRSNPDGLRPVVVSLADRPRRTLELGAGYSTSEGVGLDGRYIIYNRLGRADTLTLAARLAQLERRITPTLALPHWRRPQQTLTLGAEIRQLETDAFDEDAVTARADVTRRFGKLTFVTVGVSLDLTRTADKTTVNGAVVLGRERNLAIGTLLGAFSLDRSNDPLNPVRGYRLEARTEPTFITGDDTLGFLRTTGQASAYLPLDDGGSTVLAGRLRLGAIIGGRIPNVPAARRFYAGGGGSVRGYQFQAVGPRLADNTPQGGLSLFEASFEGRRRVRGPISVVGFVDAGSVGIQEYPDFKEISVGAGVGVRYDLGFGPIRADIAVPLNKRQGDAAFQIYLSIGQSF